MYKITIEEIKTEKVEKQESYVHLKSEFIGASDYHNLNYDQRKDYKEIEAPGSTIQYEKKIFGYPGKVLFDREVTTKLYEQTVENLNIKAVLISINGI